MNKKLVVDIRIERDLSDLTDEKELEHFLTKLKETNGIGKVNKENLTIDTRYELVDTDI